MSNNPPPGNDPERELAKRAFRVGMSKAHYLNTRIAAVARMGILAQWNSADIDAAVIDVRALAEEIWGPEN